MNERLIIFDTTLRDALKRHTTAGLWALLLLAGSAERSIKGVGERHDPWLALDEICMRLAGRGPLV